MNTPKSKTSRIVVLSGLLAASLAVLALGSAADAAPSREAKKIEDVSKKQEDRMSAVNRALEQSLSERAKSQNDFERNEAVGRPDEDRKRVREDRLNDRQNDRLAARQQATDRAMDTHIGAESREARTQMNRDQREETRREKRLNWLND